MINSNSNNPKNSNERFPLWGKSFIYDDPFGPADTSEMKKEQGYAEIELVNTKDSLLAEEGYMNQNAVQNMNLNVKQKSLK